MSTIIVNGIHTFECYATPKMGQHSFPDGVVRNALMLPIQDATYDEISKIFVDGAKIQIKDSQVVYNNETGLPKEDSDGSPMTVEEVFDYTGFTVAGSIIDCRNHTWEVYMGEFTQEELASQAANLLMGRDAKETIGIQAAKDARAWIESISAFVPDEQILKMPTLFQTWEDALQMGERLEKNRVVRKNGQLYRVVQAVTPQSHQPPDGDGMLAIYRPISQSHTGTQEDPIPWVYGMDCTAGTYYSYEGHTYQVAQGGDMIPCVWAPGMDGLWQWDFIK